MADQRDGVDPLHGNGRDEAQFQDSRRHGPRAVPFLRRRQEVRILPDPTDRGAAIETRLVDEQASRGFRCWG